MSCLREIQQCHLGRSALETQLIKHEDASHLIVLRAPPSHSQPSQSACKSQNRRGWKESLVKESSPTSLLKQVLYNRSHGKMSRQVLNNSREGDSNDFVYFSKKHTLQFKPEKCIRAGGRGEEEIMIQIKMSGKQGTAVGIMRSSAVITIGWAVV